MSSPTFEFVPFGSTARDCAISCDGLVDGTSLHASHWAGNRTPPEIKADTSTEIALRLAQRGTPPGATVANNHFDADGVLAVFALTNPDVALRHASLLVAAAEVGDFDEWPRDDRGLRLEMAIRAIAGGAWPSATAPRTLAGGDAGSYELVLPRLVEVLERLDEVEALWGDEWRALLGAERRAREGALEVERSEGITVFLHKAGTPELPGPVLARRAARDTTRWLLALEQLDGTFHYRYERPRWAWADTVERPGIASPSRNAATRGLGDGWSIKGDLGMTGIARTSRPVRTQPGDVVLSLLRHDEGARSAGKEATSAMPRLMTSRLLRP
jgi:hypothetical protein